MKVSPLPAALPAPPLLGWRWGSPCRAGGPRDTLRFKGQLLAQPSRRVPVPPARLLPGQAVQGRLCSAGSAGSGPVLEGCVGGICCCCIARKMRLPLAAPREGAEAGPGEGTRDGGGQLCSPELCLQPGSGRSARWEAACPARPSMCPTVAGGAGITPSSCPIKSPRAGVLLGGTWVPLTLLAAPPVPSAERANECGDT